MTNHHHTSYWGVVLYAIMSAAVVVAAGAQDQVLALYYAVAVFVAFLAGLAAMARYSLADRAWLLLAVNLAGAATVCRHWIQEPTTLQGSRYAAGVPWHEPGRCAHADAVREREQRERERQARTRRSAEELGDPRR